MIRRRAARLLFIGAALFTWFLVHGRSGGNNTEKRCDVIVKYSGGIMTLYYCSTVTIINYLRYILF